MIKSTKTALKFSNSGKLKQVHRFISEYRSVVSKFVDTLWVMEKVPTLLTNDITSQMDTWLSARMVQCAGKQASGIVRGTRKKQEKRIWMVDKLTKQNLLKKARKLQSIIDSINISKPDINNVEPELDSRFVHINLNNKTSFDGWLTLTSIGSKFKMVLPFRKSKHFNKMLVNGEIKTGIRLSETNITFMFEIPEVVKKTSGDILGIDIGKTNVLSCSNNHLSQKNKHGHDLNTIITSMNRKKKGSKGFKRSEDHRTNYVNWSVNQLNLSQYKQVNLENIKNLRRGKHTSRSLGHWTYTEIFGKLEDYCSEHGVHVHKISPTYTSQRCSVCGWTRKNNRKGKMFKCGECGFIFDADLNASRNIALPLLGISKQQRLQQLNRTGFYWRVEGQEIIVPDVTKTSSHDIFHDLSNYHRTIISNKS